MATKSPAEAVQDTISLMREKMDPKSGYRDAAVDYGVFSANISLEVQEQTSEQAARTAFAKRVTAAKVEAAASEADKLALRNQRLAKATESKSIKDEVSPKEDGAVDADDLMAQLEGLGIKLNQSQSKKLDAAKKEAATG